MRSTGSGAARVVAGSEWRARVGSGMVCGFGVRLPTCAHHKPPGAPSVCLRTMCCMQGCPIDAARACCSRHWQLVARAQGSHGKRVGQ